MFCSRTCTTHSLKKQPGRNDESNAIYVYTESGTEKSEVKLGYSESASGFLTYSQQEINQVYCERM